jgi:hypothetical protein
VKARRDGSEESEAAVRCRVMLGNLTFARDGAQALPSHSRPLFSPSPAPSLLFIRASSLHSTSTCTYHVRQGTNSRSPSDSASGYQASVFVPPSLPNSLDEHRFFSTPPLSNPRSCPLMSQTTPSPSTVGAFQTSAGYSLTARPSFLPFLVHFHRSFVCSCVVLSTFFIDGAPSDAVTSTSGRRRSSCFASAR